MDFAFTADERAFAEEVRRFLRAQPLDSFPLEGMDAGYGSGAHSRAFMRALGAQGWLSMGLHNTAAFARHFGDRVNIMEELATEGYTGHMYLDGKGDAVAFIWGSTREYHDRHFYGCTFPVKKGEFFEFGGELARAYWGTTLSVDLQLRLWKAMQAQGCNTVVDVCDAHNIPALKLHIRMGYQEQGRLLHVYRLFGRWRFFRETRYIGSRLDADCTAEIV